MPCADERGLLRHAELGRERTWSDQTTYAVHESLLVRAEFIHEAEPAGTQWKTAAYESPVGERLWHATASATVPVEIMRVLLDSLAYADAVEIATSDHVSEASISEATRPLADAGWKHTIDGRSIRWQAPDDRPVSVQVDAFAAHEPHSTLPTWTFRGGDASSPQWTLHFSPHAAAPVLQDVAFEVANGLTHQPAAARPQGLNALSRSDFLAQQPPRPGSARSR